jgi:Pentapeptide repeats (8 copies)
MREKVLRRTWSERLDSKKRDFILVVHDPAVQWVFLLLSVAVLLIGGYVFFWMIPNEELALMAAELSSKEFYALRNSIRQTFAQAMGGTVLLIGLYFTGRTLWTSREGQITDRFTKAVNQMGESGPEKLPIRLGGIYALERIARDSQRDHWPIMEILTAYVREHAPWKEEAHLQDELSPSATQPTQNNQSDSRPAVDIQAILTVLGRRRWGLGYGEEHPLDLTEADLRGAALRKTYFMWADFRGAHLEGASLWSANLEAALFENVHLMGAFLGDARLEGATGLTIEQLATVKTLYRARLDPSLFKQIKEKYPQLLEKPDYI